MTKTVRIENADNAAWCYPVVEVWEQRANGEPDVLVRTVHLNHPTKLDQFYIHGTQYLVVKEGLTETKKPD